MSYPLKRGAPFKSLLLIITKHISTLDYAAPLLWKIKQRCPDINVAVLYCALNRKKILRGSRFYTELFHNCNIPEYDFADFLPSPFSYGRDVWRKLFLASDWDSSPLEEWLRWLRFDHTIANRALALKRHLEIFLLNQVNPEITLGMLAPDVILLDHRTPGSKYSWSEYFEGYFIRSAKRVVLLPHGPHHMGPTAFMPFTEGGDPLPAFCDHWVPLICDRPWTNIPEKRAQFAYVGYPGLDSDWLRWVRWGRNSLKASSGGRTNSRRPLKCLFIIRKFLKKGQSRPPGHDAFIYEHGEFAYYLNLVADALRQAPVAIELVVKPHPSNDFGSVKEVFLTSNIPHWSVTNDSIYAELHQCDFVISLYSTTLLIPAMAGIPVILLHSRIQDEIQQWDELKELYTRLHFYLEKPEGLAVQLKEVIKIVSEGRPVSEEAWNEDVRHLRHFYPDGAMQRCLDRLGL